MLFGTEDLKHWVPNIGYYKGFNNHQRHSIFEVSLKSMML